jgi:hypothetical protein
MNPLPFLMYDTEFCITLIINCKGKDKGKEIPRHALRVITHPSSSVVSHVLIAGNQSVRSGTVIF